MNWWYAIIALLCTAFGYLVCWCGTWIQMRQQDARVRALAVDIGVIVDMQDEVPAEWVLDQLTSIIQESR